MSLLVFVGCIGHLYSSYSYRYHWYIYLFWSFTVYLSYGLFIFVGLSIMVFYLSWFTVSFFFYSLSSYHRSVAVSNYGRMSVLAHCKIVIGIVYHILIVYRSLSLVISFFFSFFFFHLFYIGRSLSCIYLYRSFGVYRGHCSSSNYCIGSLFLLLCSLFLINICYTIITVSFCISLCLVLSLCVYYMYRRLNYCVLYLWHRLSLFIFR